MEREFAIGDDVEVIIPSDISSIKRFRITQIQEQEGEETKYSTITVPWYTASKLKRINSPLETIRQFDFSKTSFKIEPIAVVTLCEGAGTPDDVCREVKYYYSMNRELIARADPTENTKL